MKKWLILLLLPAFLFAQNKEETLKPEDSENLVEVKTLNDLIQSKEIEEEKKEEPQKEQKETQPESKEEPKEKEPEKINNSKDKEKGMKPLVVAKQEKKKANVFDGKLSLNEIFIEKKGKNLVLWIKKKNKVLSVALISPANWKLKGHYFLRSPEKIAGQKDNTLWYNGLPLGNEKKLYFLASSSPKKHPLLGNAYSIIIPNIVTFGYNKTTGCKEIVPGQTDMIIRLFKKKEGQGGYQDNRFRIPSLDAAKLEKSEIKVSKIEKKGNLAGLSFTYQGKSFLIKRISVETEKKEILLHDFVKNLTYPKYFQIGGLSFNKDDSIFKMSFIVVFNIKKNKKFLLKVQSNQETVSLPIDMDALEEPKKEGTETQEEGVGDQEESKEKEPEKKEIPAVKETEKKPEPQTQKEVKKEEVKENKTEEPKKEGSLPDELNLKVQGQENK